MGWELEGSSSRVQEDKVSGLQRVYQPVIHYVRDTDTVHGSDFMFMGLWRALQ